MGTRIEVPITPKVLAWALDESGVSMSEVAEATKLDESDIRGWAEGRRLPSVTELRTLAAALHRQFATFLLAAPPQDDMPEVAFRQPLGGPTRRLTPEERRFLRRAGRLQAAHKWLIQELNYPAPAIPAAAPGDDPADVGHRLRRSLNVTLADQQAWRSASHSFDGWRAALERLGVLVFQFPLGERSCRGFSIWDEHAPVIAVNTAWPDEARIFTLFHECGHLVTRASSACAPPPSGQAPTNRVERWCEAFSAAVLIPEELVDHVTRVEDLAALSRLARRNHVSVRAMAIRLIELGKATWKLYRAIPSAAELKAKAAGGTGRSLVEQREDEIGWRGIEVFVDAARREVITESQALDYLDVRAADFERLAADASLR